MLWREAELLAAFAALRDLRVGSDQGGHGSTVRFLSAGVGRFRHRTPRDTLGTSSVSDCRHLNSRLQGSTGRVGYAQLNHANTTPYSRNNLIDTGPNFIAKTYDFLSWFDHPWNHAGGHDFINALQIQNLINSNNMDIRACTFRSGHGAHEVYAALDTYLSMSDVCSDPKLTSLVNGLLNRVRHST